MELTAKTIREVTFGAKVRGYDPAEVDEFIAAVADGVDELQERLRRAVERATRAEQQLAAGGGSVAAEPVSVAPEPVAAGQPSTSEIGKVWERAVAAAEDAVSEAKQTAQKLLDDATRQSENTVATARSEAQRLSEEGQRQLRADIAQLEAARDQLHNQVDSLGRYIDEERSNVRTVLNRVLSVLEEDARLSSPPSSNTGSSSGAPYTPPAAPAEPVAAPPQPEPVSYQSEPQTESAPTPSANASAEVSAPSAEEAHSQEDAPSSEEDPFLAELRKAVKDDVPLGPRENAEEDPLNGLYSDDDDDKKGFFPWKK